MLENLRYLLLQVRNADDPMRRQEVECFAETLPCEERQITVFDLLQGAPTMAQLRPHDVVLLGGSGDYSVAEGGPWLEAALEAMRELRELAKPTFASCWGFQAMARALGGRVVTDLNRAEVGTVMCRVTAAGAADPVFGGLGESFAAQMGHQDIVEELPADAVLLASSERVVNQAFCIRGLPIYCTQFHPELSRRRLLQRVWAYPQYIERIVGVSLEEFAARCQDSHASNQLLRRFLTHVFA